MAGNFPTKHDFGMNGRHGLSDKRPHACGSFELDGNRSAVPCRVRMRFSGRRPSHVGAASCVGKTYSFWATPFYYGAGS